MIPNLFPTPASTPTPTPTLEFLEELEVEEFIEEESSSSSSPFYFHVG